MDGSNNGEMHDVPWSSIFDPAANVRALTAVQAEGFRAASELVDRFVRMVATRPDGGAAAARQASPLSNEQRADFLGATDIEPLIRSWWAMAGQFLVGGAPQTAPPTAGISPALDFTGSAASGRLEFETGAGDSATAEVWLHNSADVDLGRIRLRCSALMADDGSVIEAEACRIHPKTIPVPGRSSRGVGITVKVTKKTAPGLYRGTLLGDGRPELWLPGARAVRPAGA